MPPTFEEYAEIPAEDQSFAGISVIEDDLVGWYNTLPR